MLPVGRSELMFASGSFLSPSLIRILQRIFFSPVLEQLLIIKPGRERLVFVNLDMSDSRSLLGEIEVCRLSGNGFCVIY